MNSILNKRLDIFLNIGSMGNKLVVYMRYSFLKSVGSDFLKLVGVTDNSYLLNNSQKMFNSRLLVLAIYNGRLFQIFRGSRHIFILVAYLGIIIKNNLIKISSDMFRRFSKFRNFDHFKTGLKIRQFRCRPEKFFRSLAILYLILL